MSEGFVYVQPNDANTIKTLPSLSNHELWELFIERGVHEPTSESLVSKFDVWLHSKGRLFYRLKPGKVVRDSADNFLCRDTNDSIHVMGTHDIEDGIVSAPDVFENSHSIDVCDLWDEMKK